VAGADKFVARSAVFIALCTSDQKVLLQRRCNTGYMDGRYDLPSGHVERGESLLDAAIRELLEETGIRVKGADLQLWHINQFGANSEDYYNFFFMADTWQGEPAITEADKCDDMQFFSLDNLPQLTAGSHVALEHLGKDEVSFSYIDQVVFDAIAGKEK
jgi:8-oxo-dGTP pyrophosphatase MutT (NUDIX family)